MQDLHNLSTVDKYAHVVGHLEEKQNSCDNFNWCAICKRANVISNETKMNMEVHSLLNPCLQNNEHWRNCSAISAAVNTFIAHFDVFVLSTTHLNRVTQ